MKVNDVKKQIKSGRIDPFYIFTGEEVEAQRVYINKIAEVTDREISRVETVADALKCKVGLLSVPKLFVVMDDKDFMTAEKAWDNITDLLRGNMLILQITSADKRMKFFKYFADKIVTFNYMDADVLIKHLKKACRLSDKNAEGLINLCGRDYGRILLEADKINQYADGSYTPIDEAYEKLVSEGIIYRQAEDAIFMFVDAVLKANPKRAYALLADCRERDTSSLAMISLLYSNFKRVLQVQMCKSSDISKTTGLSARDVAIARKSTGYWNSADIVYFLRVLQAVERKVKTGEIEEPIAIDYALTHIF